MHWLCAQPACWSADVARLPACRQRFFYFLMVLPLPHLLLQAIMTKRAT